MQEPAHRLPTARSILTECSRTRFVLPLVGVAAALLAWGLVAHLLGRPILLPGPLTTFQTLLALVTAPGFGPVLVASLGRWALAVALSVPLAVLTGAIAGLNRSGAEFMRPMVSAVRATPVISVILIALIWLPIPQVPVLVGFVVAYPLLHQGIADGLRALEAELLELAAAFRWGPLRRVVHLYLPGSWPTVASALAGVLGMSWKAVLAAEVLSLPALGIGSLLQESRTYLDTAAVLAWTLVAVLAAYAFDLAFAFVLGSVLPRFRRRPRPWKPPALVFTQVAEAPPPSPLQIQDMNFGFPNEELFRGFSLSIEAGEVCAVLGPSGCGKTTLVRLVAGLLQPESGRVLLREKPALAFQDARLLPWEPAWVQVALGMTGWQLRGSAGRDGARRLLFELGLGNCAERYPHELSGGMKRRLNLARAVARSSGLLLLDEPFTHLDIVTHTELIGFAHALLQRKPRTTLLVTHSPHEAMALADRVVVLSAERPVRVLTDLPTRELGSGELEGILSGRIHLKRDKSN